MKHTLLSIITLLTAALPARAFPYTARQLPAGFNAPLIKVLPLPIRLKVEELP